MYFKGISCFYDTVNQYFVKINKDIFICLVASVYLDQDQRESLIEPRIKTSHVKH